MRLEPIYTHQLEKYINESSKWSNMFDEVKFIKGGQINDLERYIENQIDLHYRVLKSASRSSNYEVDIPTSVDYLKKYSICILYRKDAFLSLIYNKKGFYLIENLNQDREYNTESTSLVYIPLDCFHELHVEVLSKSIVITYSYHNWGYKGGDEEVYNDFLSEITKIKELLYVQLVTKYQ